MSPPVTLRLPSSRAQLAQTGHVTPRYPVQQLFHFKFEKKTLRLRLACFSSAQLIRTHPCAHSSPESYFHASRSHHKSRPADASARSSAHHALPLHMRALPPSRRGRFVVSQRKAADMSDAVVRGSMTRAQAIWHSFRVRPYTLLVEPSCAGFAPSSPASRGASAVATSPCARYLFAAPSPRWNAWTAPDRTKCGRALS